MTRNVVFDALYSTLHYSILQYANFLQGIPQVLEIKGDPQGLGVSFCFFFRFSIANQQLIFTGYNFRYLDCHFPKKMVKYLYKKLLTATFDSWQSILAINSDKYFLTHGLQIIKCCSMLTSYVSAVYVSL
jgi:hypothetical protein